MKTLNNSLLFTDKSYRFIFVGLMRQRVKYITKIKKYIIPSHLFSDDLFSECECKVISLEIYQNI